MPALRHHFFAKLVTLSTLLLIAAGGLVTSTGSGLSVPDWPLSYGQFFPPMIGGIRFEHSHRLIAGSVGILTVILCFLFLKHESRRWVKGLAVGAVLAVLLQAILGAITVIYLLPLPVSVSHACLGQLFFCLLGFLALCTSKEWLAPPHLVSPSSKSFSRLSATTTVFIFLQLVAGAAVRHSGHGVQVHLFIAFFIIVHAVFLNVKALRDRTMFKHFIAQIVLMDCLLAAQVFLGLGSLYYKFILERAEMPRFWEIILATAHQTVGAVILLNAVLMTARSFRLFERESGRGDSSDYLELMKLRVTLAALATTFVGYFLASPSLAISARLLHALLGALLIGGGANALNQYFERDTDKMMRRTEMRPIPSGRLTPGDVFWFGLISAIAGIAELFIFVNILTGLLGLLTFVSYAYCYTPLKRVTTLNTFVGAVPGALPIAMGWTAASGEWGVAPLVLFLILFLWQIPHFFAIAWVYKEDYQRSGLRMMPAEDPEGHDTAIRILLYSTILLPATFLPISMGLSGPFYMGCSFIAGIAFMILATLLYLRRLEGAKTFVGTSIYYLFALMTALVIDKLWAS